MANEKHRNRLRLAVSVFFFGALGFCYFAGRNQIKDDRASAVTRLKKLPDDALEIEYQNFSSSESRKNWLIGIGVIAVMFGLLFTGIGNNIVNQFVEGFNR